MTHPRTKGFALFLFGVSAMASGYLFIECLRRYSGMTLLAAAYAKTLNTYSYSLLLLGDRVLAISFWCTILLTLLSQLLYPFKVVLRVYLSSPLPAPARVEVPPLVDGIRNADV